MIDANDPFGKQFNKLTELVHGSGGNGLGSLYDQYHKLLDSEQRETIDHCMLMAVAHTSQAVRLLKRVGQNKT